MDEQHHTTAPSPWLTVTEAAERARVGRRVIYLEVKAGRLRAARIGGRRELRFKIDYIDAWLESSATPVTVEPFRRDARNPAA
jgi:excisionase family DNA binding protein